MLILLDIDGVMAPVASWKPAGLLSDGFTSFSSKAVANLQLIIAETAASIVLTTSHKSTYNLSQWQRIFRERGINSSIDKLTDNSANLSRKDEVLNWVQNRVNNSESFVIIDDDKSLNGLPEAIKNKLVLTSSMIGLNEEAAFEAIAILRHSDR